jgi:predicted CoA-binding protein
MTTPTSYMGDNDENTKKVAVVGRSVKNTRASTI